MIIRKPLRRHKIADAEERDSGREARQIRLPATILNNIINVVVSFLLDLIYSLRTVEYDLYYLLGRILPGSIGRFFSNFAGYPQQQRA
jgi:hypothetical protein